MISRVSSFFLLLLSTVYAIPVPPTKPIDLTGTVQKWAWIDGTISKSSGDGMLLSIHTVPTYYVILKVASVPEQTRKTLSWYAQSQGRVAIIHPIAGIKLEDDEILVSLDLGLTDSIAKGASIKIKGYTMQGDEWGCESDWVELHVDGKAIPKRIQAAENDGADQPAIAPKSKPELRQNTNPESGDRPQ